MGSLLINNVTKLDTSSYSETSFSILGTEIQQMKEELRTKLKKIKLSFWHMNTISSFPKIILSYIQYFLEQNKEAVTESSEIPAV